MLGAATAGRPAATAARSLGGAIAVAGARSDPGLLDQARSAYGWPFATMTGAAAMVIAAALVVVVLIDGGRRVPATVE